ncbi:hypothetical protein Acor_73940 [Acrocarpospora corrugata]|uniref:Damage-control phosphatase ARMT1-like metal-binding domain-containing protein n=1 Tax=Acrocarpospora corrugata TaxID=35763 RepID=A0A5M3W917_9ACTN|nr:damage-control phosphatase ARMT1 family protein [Acrocarpospora corrugata]GES05326.1 hypothetical protein Acor_73940 [Acrocarpospora corrugata]
MPTPLPPELLNNEPEGFAWGVWHDRTPKLITQIKEAVPYGPAQRQGFDALEEEISSGLMQPLGDAAPERDLWVSWGEDYFGKPWIDTPFLWSESYFFRRVLEVTGYFAPGPWYGLDPFEPMKTAELSDPSLEPDLQALDSLSTPQDKLLASLWGNRADLVFHVGRTRGATHPETGGLIIDQSDQLWSHLGPDARVVVIADNAGREFLADLVLIDHLLGHDLAASVTLHLKPRPYYVSDATTADFVACLRRLSRTRGAAEQISARLRRAVAGGSLTLDTHDFYCSPWDYRRMPGDLAARLRSATITILKGDLNYRRLVGDRSWPATTDFAAVSAYFPSPVAALRTLKSDVVTGVDAATEAQLDASGLEWRTDGTHGLIQVAAMPGATGDGV